MVANLPPSFADLLYKGYPSLPVTMLDDNARGYRLEHFPSIMHDEFGFSVPRGHASYFSSQLHTNSCIGYPSATAQEVRYFAYHSKIACECNEKFGAHSDEHTQLHLELTHAYDVN
ncbi:unnamed protein product [Onchocerca ochengi]|uniref:C2H2-type domain-containing protein n=1 Tax=Onchocerca ochengi TaxID=42157 RepID=A0A182EPE1_ONCOC|nr:unnamed protein product [Onchocerca ochengi]